MYCQLSFSAESFERLIRYRIADLFRPLSAPVPFPPNAQSWLDGVVVTNIEFNRVDRDRFVLVNELDALGSVGPASGYGYNASALAMELAVDIFFVRVEDVAAAGLAQPPVLTKSVPFGIFHVTVRASVGASGIPVLQMELDTARLGALDLPPPVIARVAASASASFPFDIGAQLKDVFPPGNGKVLNAGITRDEAGAIVLRFTFPGQVWQSAIAHSYDWEHFHGPTFVANLGADAWCMDLDGGAVASGLAAKVNSAFKNEKPITFNSGYEAGFVDDAVPRVVITKRGAVENACAGNDIRFDAFVNVDFSVPADNLLRGTLSFDLDKNDWDVAKCFGLVMINPLSILITVADHGEFGLGIALSVAAPARAFLVTLALGLLIGGVDEAIAQGIIADRLDDDPLVTGLPDGGFAYDKPLAPTSALTRDWLVLKKCTGSGGRMLLSGELRVPDAILPRLAASDLEGLSRWVLIDRCSPGKGQVSTGSLTLSLVPGYGADPAAVPPAKVPTIPLKWGERPDGGDLLFQVLNDSLGVYQDPAPEYRMIYFPGIPGTLEVKLRASTVRQPRYSGFASSPYALRLRFFTNGGVREYEFTAPPVLTDFNETNEEAAERINKCMLRGASLLFRKYLELKWRVDPPDVLRDLVAQRWDVHVRGLEPGRRATVWNQDTGAQLVDAYADRTGRLDVSLILRGDQQAGVLLVGLDGEPFQGAGQVRRAAVAATDAPASTAEVVMRQTLLTEIDHLEFGEQVESLHLSGSGPAGALVVRTAGGRRYARSVPFPYAAGLAVPMPAAGTAAAGGDAFPQGLVAWRGEQRRFTLLARHPGRTEVLAEYSARSSYDLAAARDDLLAQVGSDGRGVTLFRAGAPVLFGTQEWDDSPDDKAQPR